MKALFLALLLPASIALAGPVDYTSPPSDNSQAITPATVSASTGIFALSGANSSSLFPYSPLMVFGNANTYLQFVIQNLSNGNNASSDFILTNDLGADTSYYLDIGINSSKFSQATQTAEASSSTFVGSSDSDLLLWAGMNGGLNGAVNERLIFGSSNPVTANIAGYVMPATASGPGAWVFASSVTVKGPTGAPAAIFSPVLSSGTVSSALSGTFTNTTLGLCVANSTGSMVLPQVSEIRFDVHCTISVASLAAVLGAGVIVDGGFIDGETASKGAVAPQEAVSTDGTNLSFTIYASGLSAASHSYCFSPFVSTNTGTIDSTNSVCHLHAHMMP